jgi:hypothetical protein
VQIESGAILTSDCWDSGADHEEYIDDLSVKFCGVVQVRHFSYGGGFIEIVWLPTHVDSLLHAANL